MQHFLQTSLDFFFFVDFHKSKHSLIVTVCTVGAKTKMFKQTELVTKGRTR